MKVLMLGGTRFFGKHMVDEFLKQGDEVTIATRGLAQDTYGDLVDRITLDRNISENTKSALSGKKFDIVCDNFCYSSNALKDVLESVKCNRYVLTSTISVYPENAGLDTKEDSFNPYENKLVWCNYGDFKYGELKRQSETALFQEFNYIKAAAVRLPYVIGVDDYTKRLYYYVDCIVNAVPLNIDNINSDIPFIRSDDAGKFLVFIAKNDFAGPINAGSDSAKLRDIITYIENKTSQKAIFDCTANEAPFNKVKPFSINTEKAKKLDYDFLTVKSCVFELLDEYIRLAKNKIDF